jgi:Spy/CpxP family protein refolding chaperone
MRTVKALKIIVGVLLVVTLIISVIAFVVQADEQASPPMEAALFSMDDYWLEQIYYEMNTLNLTVQQFRNQFNAMHLTSQQHLTETRSYHSNVVTYQNEVKEADTTLTTIMYWSLGLTGFQTALLIVIIFALPWGRQ